MSDGNDSRPAASAATTAGGLLRQARQAQGLHIAALAAAIKVTPRKLEALEADRFSELPDATFTRALAQSVCRTLKVDAGPVLALLPPPNGHRLEQVAEGLNTPFRERPGRLAPQDWVKLSSVAVWAPLLLLAAAAAIYLVPAHWLSSLALPGPLRAASGAAGGMPDVVTSDIPAVQSSASGVPPAAEPLPLDAAADAGAAAPPEPRATLPAEAPAASSGVALAAASAAPAAAASGATLQVSATDDSWVDVTDARGQSLLSRIVRPGETVAVDGAMPMKVKIGNARVTQLLFRGQTMALAPFTRDNIARLELK